MLVSGSFAEDMGDSKHRVAPIANVGIVSNSRVKKLLQVSGLVGDSKTRIRLLVDT